MPKLTLSSLSNLLGNEQSAASTINSNNAAIETALENTLSRDGTSPNTMSADLDMNSNNIINLPAPASATEPWRKQDHDAFAEEYGFTALQDAVSAAEAAQQAAEAAQVAAETAETNAETAETNAETAETNAESAQQAAEDARDAAVLAQQAAELAETNAETAETNAETAQAGAEAALAALTGATSTTSLTVGTGNKVFTTQAGIGFVVGQRWRAASDDSSLIMDGEVVSYLGTTLTLDIDYTEGSGTHADWNLSLIGPRGPAGAGLEDVVDDTTPQLGGMLDVNGNSIGDGTLELLKFEETASAINEITIVNAAVGDAPIVKATGDDTDINLDLEAKGTGKVRAGGSNVLVASDIGSSVQGYDADTLKADTDDTLAAGFDTTAVNDGTKSSGTYTPVYTGGNIKRAVNGGAHTLAPQATDGQIIIQYTNNSSAGAITTSGFTNVSGDTFTTTDGDDFLCFLTVVNGFSQLHVVALQ